MARTRAKRIKRPNGAGSIYQRRDGRWHARYTAIDPETGQRVRRSLYGATEQEARAKLISALDALERGALPLHHGRTPTLAEYGQRWLSQCRVRPRTLHRYGELLEHALPSLGHLQLTRLEPHHVGNLLSRLRDDGLSARTCNHVRAVLRNLLSEAKREGLVLRNVAELARPLPLEGVREGTTLSAEQVRNLLAAAEHHRDGPLWVLALATGARQSELIGLRWSDVDLERGRVTIARTLQRAPRPLREEHGEWLEQPTKTRRSRRTIPLASIAVEALHRQRRLQAEERLRAGSSWQDKWGDLVFREPDGSPLRGTKATQRLQAQLARLGLPRIRFHDLRHSAATFLALSGIPVATAMAVLGHSTSATTLNIYTHVAPELAREAAEALDRVLRGDVERR
ncbi:MAG TPA: site-specific integrase [Candidatus Dormibacteraeota bacterium]|jgi:integrase|nr:site-specific integrase [Candidatus Dormibacteraeota bacterium]